MANTKRGEVDFTFTDIDGDERRFVLKFNNQAKVGVEQHLGMARGQILQQFVQSGGEADQIRHALFFHGTRKHHQKELKTPNAVYAVLDDLDEAMDEADDGGRAMRQDLMASLMAAYTRSDKAELLSMLQGEPDEDGEDAGDDPGQEPDEEPGVKPGTGAPVPEEPVKAGGSSKGKAPKKAESHLSEVGSDS
jgi:hypothetical protein